MVKVRERSTSWLKEIKVVVLLHNLFNAAGKHFSCRKGIFSSLRERLEFELTFMWKAIIVFIVHYLILFPVISLRPLQNRITADDTDDTTKKAGTCYLYLPHQLLIVFVYTYI